MNVVLWIFQVALGLLYLAGGVYKMFMFGTLASQVPSLPPAGWIALGVVEAVCAILLVIPADGRWRPVLPPLAAGILALETLGLAALYAQYSLTLTAANPLVWAGVMGMLVAFVAYGRYTLRPLA